MKILLIEPFFEGSHAKWAKGFQANSRHEIQLLTLRGAYWKWRMYGGAVTLAERFMELDFEPDLILATDMLDLATFQALTRKKTAQIPFALYFHENQITYPWSPNDQDLALQRNNQYGFVNYTSALAADIVLYNSNFHRQSFLEALPKFLGQFPDYKNLESISKIEKKSFVLPLGMDLSRFDGYEKTASGKAVLLWNHRWEYDKNPTDFFQALFRLKEEKVAFQLIVLGKSYSKTPTIFAEAEEKLQEEIIHFGYADSFEIYAQLLQQTDILPVTSQQDFFGGSVVEAIYCQCHPILPQRLAYPEHIPVAQQETYFYTEKEGIYPKLKKAIEGIEAIRKNRSYRDFVAHYDWKNLVSRYDDFLKERTKR